jgi:multidrug efflux pump subunit AcrB
VIFFILFFVAAVSLVPMGVVKFSFMGNMDSNNIWVNLKYAPGVSLDDNQANTSKVVSSLLKYMQKTFSGDVKDISLDLGQGYSLQGSAAVGNNVSSLTLRLTDTELREIASYTMVEQIQKELVPVLTAHYPFLREMSVFTTQAGGG